MSGGHFDYGQYTINEIAIAVDDLIRNNGKEYNNFNNEVIEEFKTGLKHLQLAAIYAQRIDWLVSDDDGEESFISRLAEDLHKNEYPITSADGDRWKAADG